MSAAIVSASENFDPSSGGVLLTEDGRDLILRRSVLRAQMAGGLGRVVLEQHFVNPYDDPLHVHYTLPLPSDGAISGFSFEVDGQRVVGEVDRREDARERFEEAILEGRSAALLDQERSSVFTQEIGNIPPRTELVIEICIDQRLRWLAEGQWEWRFPTVVGPRYMGAAGRVSDSSAVSVAVDESAAVSGPKASLALVIDDDVQAAGPESPSHRLRCSRGAEGLEVGFLEEVGVALDRDVVVRWKAAVSEPAAELRVHRPTAGHPRDAEAFGLLTVTPPAEFASPGSIVPRDLIFLIDTSGSMHGEPLAQATKVASAMIETLGEGDRLELIEFSDRPRAWNHEPVLATPSNREAACEWLRSLCSGGATEMREGILRALRPLSAESQRQVVLITDGWIGFETEIVNEICRALPASSRVHTIGVGHAVNRSLTVPVARAGRGVEVIVAPDESAERAARRMVEHTNAPLRVNFTLDGDVLLEHAPAALPDLFAGCPVLIALRLDPHGGQLLLRARGAEGEWSQRIVVPAAQPGSGDHAVACTYAREAVEDLELQRAAGQAGEPLDGQIEELGLAFQISTRLTSWVAVSMEPGVDPTSPARKRKLSQALPAGTSLDQLGLRPVQTVSRMSSPQHTMSSMSDRTVSALDAPWDSERSDALYSLENVVYDEDASNECSPPVIPSVGEERLSSVELIELVARRISQSDSRLVVEIELFEALDWWPMSARLILGDGSSVLSRIDWRRGTRSGAMQPGQVLRLVLKLDGPLSAVPQRIDLEQQRGPVLRLWVE